MKLVPAENTLALAHERRQKYASEIFKYEVVEVAIVEASTKGESYVRIAQAMPVSLKNMKATRQLAQALLQAKYNVDWVTANQPEKSNGRETGGFIIYEEMRISWDTVNVHSGPQVSSD